MWAIRNTALPRSTTRSKCSAGPSVQTATVVRVPDEKPDFQAYCGAKTPRFVNQAELEVAKLLDYYGIRWEYEPRTFVLETDDEGRVIEATTPDFFLPDQNLYLEVTTMKQSLVTRKNRKIRKLRERYPDVNVKLFYRRDIERLVGKYGLDLAS